VLDSAARIAVDKKPFVATGAKDETVPYCMGEKYSAAPRKTEIITSLVKP